MSNAAVNYYIPLPPDRRPIYSSLAERVHPEFEWLTQSRARSRGRDLFEVMDTIVVHATAGYATDHVTSTWRKRKASAHWVIPDEDEPQHGTFFWATVSEAKAAYHVRDDISSAPHLGSGANVNNRSLGIEIVNTQDVQGFTDPYSDWQIQSAVNIVLYAWAKYPKLKHVISHARLDPSRRSDPGSNFPWAKFQEMILSHKGLPAADPLLAAKPVQKRSEAFPSNCCGP